MRFQPSGWLLAAAVALLPTLPMLATRPVPTAADRFDHARHARLFLQCTSCHAGAADTTASLFPTPSGCVTCHDGTVERKVDWRPPAGPRANNLRFTHATHARRFARQAGRDSTLACMNCHAPEGAGWMQQIQPAVLPNCFSCHGIHTAHLAAPDTACATCHLPLAQAGALTRQDVAGFPKPPSHREAGFTLGGHGRLAGPVSAGRRQFEVAPSCATCHARDFCLQCHVNAPEVKQIQALATDPRSLALKGKLEPPASHHAAGFVSSHGGMARKNTQACATCHTRESCLTCHRGQLSVSQALFPAGPGRAPGAQVAQQKPPSHTEDFADTHGPVAAAQPLTCSSCHVRAECLECHRPTSATDPSAYHPPAFLSRHPAAAYARESDCSTCHNQAAFCTACHVRAGLYAQGPLGQGFHDAQPGFLFGHGQAARQNLESCTSCHVERDCLTCHSAQGGRRFNPHGADFDAKRLKEKNPEMCTACHGQNIP